MVFEEEYSVTFRWSPALGTSQLLYYGCAPSNTGEHLRAEWHCELSGDTPSMSVKHACHSWIHCCSGSIYGSTTIPITSLLRVEQSTVIGDYESSGWSPGH